MIAMRGFVAIGLALACGCLPPDKVDKPATTGDPDVDAVAHAWIVENHIVTGNSTLTEGDAILMHGRKVDITASSYKSPFQGTCDDSGREKRTRVLDDVSIEVDLAGEQRQVPVRFGLPQHVTEFRLTCTGNKHTPPLTIFIGAQRAMTCFSGVCYLLAPG
jgi:hypothetical protein